MNNNRLTRVNDEIKKEISLCLINGIKDPRIGTMTSITKVETTNDLKISKVYVSVLGGDEDKKQAMEGIKNAAGYIRKLLAERINLRITPELKFILDDSMEYAMRMEKLINEVNKPKE